MPHQRPAFTSGAFFIPPRLGRTGAIRSPVSTLSCVATLLLKTEPTEYAFDDLVRDGRTVWSGVKNAAALIALRAARKGDEAFIYHTGSEKRLVGLAKLTSGPYPDPSAGDERLVVIDLAPLRALPTPVTLAQVKGDARFSNFALVTQSRLSVMPVPGELDTILRQWAGLGPASRTPRPA
jgi:predicted RNA-binding protein with PUA-like domain